MLSSRLWLISLGRHTWCSSYAPIQLSCIALQSDNLTYVFSKIGISIAPVMHAYIQRKATKVSLLILHLHPKRPFHSQDPRVLPRQPILAGIPGDGHLWVPDNRRGHAVCLVTGGVVDASALTGFLGGAHVGEWIARPGRPLAAEAKQRPQSSQAACGDA